MSRMDARPLPIGLAYVAGHLDQDRHTLNVLDLMFSEDYLADVEDAVKTSILERSQTGPAKSKD